MTCILGINLAYHECSASLIIDGQLIAAFEEERFNRIRHAKVARVDNGDQIPFFSINKCLELGSISISDISEVACSFEPEKRYQLNVQYGDYRLVNDWGSKEGEAEFRRSLLSVPEKMNEYYQYDFTDKWHWLPHHSCHHAGAYYQSGFSEAALLCIDGIGEFSTTSWGVADKSRLVEIGRIDYPNSLGLLWEKIALFLGFTEYDASKVMSLAAFGSAAKYKFKMELLLKDADDLFLVDNTIAKLRSLDQRSISSYFSITARNTNAPFKQEHYDLAAAIQQRTNSLLLNLVKQLKLVTGKSHLCYSGGVALNCVANQLLCESNLFDHIYIQPAANDAGTSIGAAYIIASQKISVTKLIAPQHSFLGDSYTNEQLEQVLIRSRLDYVKHSDITYETAQLLAEGYITGWFQGRMEFGPRALGKRSILGDPRTIKTKEKLDTEIKLRDSFRPYSPSILAEHVDDWFLISESAKLAATAMLCAPKVKNEKKSLIPAVTHVDSSSRIQIVHLETSPRYHQLISQFYQITGVPMLLNTSFNSCEPIVQSPEQAIHIFQSTTLDVLVLGDFMVRKNNASTR